MVPLYLLFALALSGLIGVSLGLIGGGGSIITVPILVYVAGIETKTAIPMSLAVVGTTSFAGGLVKWRGGEVHTRAFLLFSVSGMVGAQFGARLTRLVPSPVLLTLFALLMVFVGFRMIRKRGKDDGVRGGACRPVRCVAAGTAVGVLTGFLGVGGGFLIVPALLAFARLPMKTAVGTSLLVIAANSASGFVGHLAAGVPPMGLTAAFTAAALAGMSGGLVLSHRMQPSGLRTGFAALSFIVAAYLLVMNVPMLAQLASGGSLNAP